MSHTPGPWIVQDRNTGYLSDDSFGKYEIEDVAQNLTLAVTIGDIEELAVQEEANARLIAAAPELLEALKRATVLLQASVDLIKNNPLIEEMTVIFDGAECDGACLSEDCRIALDDAAAAIAKAQGKP